MEIRWSESVSERVERFYCSLCGLGADAIGVASLRCPRDGGWTMLRVGFVDPRMPLATAPKSVLSALADWHAAEVRAWEKNRLNYPAITLGDHAREEDEAAVQPHALREAIDHALGRAGIPLRGEDETVLELNPDDYATLSWEYPSPPGEGARLGVELNHGTLRIGRHEIVFAGPSPIGAPLPMDADVLLRLSSTERAYLGRIWQVEEGDHGCSLRMSIRWDATPATPEEIDKLVAEQILPPKADPTAAAFLATPEGRAFLADPDAVRRAKDVVGQLDRGLLGEADAFAALPRGMTVALARAIAGAP